MLQNLSFIGVTFPGVYGTNVNKFFWSDELANDARNYARKCNFYHPTGELDRLKEGENLAMMWIADTSIKSYEEDLPSVGRLNVNNLASQEWFYFSKARGKPFAQLASPTAQAFSPMFTPEAGHYTQMMWDETTHVGCANVLCSGLIEENRKLMSQPRGGPYKAFYTVCRYKKAGNDVSRFNFFDRTFDKSKIASKCPHGNENGLCLPEGYTPPATCNWNADIEENVDYKVYNARHNAVFDLWWGSPAPGRTLKTSYAPYSYGEDSERFNFVRDEKSCNYLITVGGYAVVDLGRSLELDEFNPDDLRQHFQIEADNGSIRIRNLDDMYLSAESSNAVIRSMDYDPYGEDQTWNLERW